jgi:hypothetical protein
MVPEEWRDYATGRLGGHPPEMLTDGGSAVHAVAAAAARRWEGPDGSTLDRAIQATREASFPHFGLSA